MTAADLDRLHRVVSDVLGLPLDAVRPETSPDTVAAWDSVSHLNLVLSLEQEFGIAFTPEESTELLTVEIIALTLDEKLGVS